MRPEPPPSSNEGQLDRNYVEWASILGPPERCSGVQELKPGPIGSGALLEPKLFQGFDELIPVVPVGETRVNMEFVVVGSHGNGTVKVTEPGIG